MAKKVLFIHSNGNDYRDKRIIEELQSNSSITFVLADYKTVLWSLKNNPHKINADCVINMHNNKELGELLEQDGVKCFNKSSSTILANDKWKTYNQLNEIGIPQPKTSLTQDFKPPYIYKDRFGSLGRNVFLIEEEKSLINDDKKYIFQEFIEESKGKSVRVVLVGKKVVACNLKENKKDFRSHLKYGAIQKEYSLTSLEKEMCQKIAINLDLDYCAIDLLVSNEGLKVLEVNSRPGLDGIEEFTNINIARMFVDYIIENI